MSPGAIIGILLIIGTIAMVSQLWKSRKWIVPSRPFPDIWKQLLEKHVLFYNALSAEEQKLFQYKVHEFLLNCKIIGVDTSVEEIDKVLVASSATIPIFSFPEWKYTNLHEVLLYPDAFNMKFQTTGPDRRILGMVGNGYMEGKMILSKLALRKGFENELDKRNTAIHEFVHLIDKMDGKVDGIPEILLQKQYTIPWLDMIKRKVEEIVKGDSDINPYGATNNAEFFSVASEYFFERPQLLKEKHPVLYDLLSQVFHHDMKLRLLKKSVKTVGRNSPCPCNSGKKFKHCCGKPMVDL